MKPVLLPFEKRLAAALGVSEETYREFKRTIDSRVQIRPSDAVAGPAATTFAINTALGVGFTLLGALFRPRPQTPPTLTVKQEGGANITDNRRYAPRFGFSSTQEIATSGQSYPLVVAKRETLDAMTYGGVRVNLLALWSQMWSYRGSQLFRGIFLLGRRNMGQIAAEGFAFGNNSLLNYGGGNTSASSARFSLYYSGNGGRLVSADNIAGRSGANDPANASNFGGTDVFQYTGLSGGINNDFCCVARPTTNTQLGLFGFCPNGMAFRVMPRMRPTCSCSIYSRNQGQEFYIECEDDTASLVDFWTAKYSWSSRSGIRTVKSGGNTTAPVSGMNITTQAVGVDDILRYTLDSRSESKTKMRFDNTNTDANVDANAETEQLLTNVGSGVAGWQNRADDNLVVGELYKIGSALCILEARNPGSSDNYFVSESANEPVGNGVTMVYDFRVVRAGTVGFVGDLVLNPPYYGTTIKPGRYDRDTDMALMTVPDRFPTASSFPQIFRCAMASFGVTRSTRLIEVGIKSTVGIKVQGATNLRACPPLKTVNYKAGQNRSGAVVPSGSKLNAAVFQSGTLSTSTLRYSGFKLHYRDGFGSWTRFSDAIFLVRSASSEALYNYLRIEFPSYSPRWQVQLEPLSAWEIRTGTGWGGDVIVLDPASPTGSRTSVSQGMRVSYNGFQIATGQFASFFGLKVVDPSADIGYGWTEGATMLDAWGRLAEKFCYDEVTTTADSGPEHEISYVNIFTPNTEQADYDDLAIIGVNILASTESTDLSQASQDVSDGYQMRRLRNGLTVGSTHLLPDLFLELLTSKTLGEGAFISDAQVDLQALQVAADWCYSRRCFFDGLLPQPVNLLDWAAETASTHLLRVAKRGSRYGLEPAVVFSAPVPISALFTAGNIDGPLEMDTVPFAERQPSSVLVKYREQSPSISNFQPGLFPSERTLFIKEATRPDTDPMIELDLSDYCTSRNHAIDAAAFLIRQRRLVDHSIKFATTPEGISAGLAVGDYIQVAYDLLYFDAFAHGVITNAGVLVTSRPDLMPAGVHRCLTWDGSQSPPVERDITVAADGTASPTGLMFARQSTTVVRRTYEITDMEIDTTGRITIEASVHPVDTAAGPTQGWSLITKDWPTYASDANWTIRQ